MRDAEYIEVILPLALKGPFTYRVPIEMRDEVVAGKRVVVPFGKKRHYAGIILGLVNELRLGAKVKDILYVLDDETVLTESQLRLWSWMADYYMSGLGPVMNFSLPGALKLSSHTIVRLNPAFETYEEFSSEEQMIIAQLNSNEKLDVHRLESLDAKAKIHRAINSLLKKGVVLVSEEMKGAAKPKKTAYLRLTGSYHSDSSISEMLEKLQRAPKQFELMMRFFENADAEDAAAMVVSKKQFLERSGLTTSILNSLIQKGVLEEFEELDQFDPSVDRLTTELNSEQDRAIQEIESAWIEKDTVLLHGVTGSGKTHVYTAIANRILDRGEQVLYLVPEIALTTQLVRRIEKLLGHEVLIYHSRQTDRERLTIWMRLLKSTEPCIVIGARSSVFLPFNHLGLIIVDEEHDGSYKQHEGSPNYNARDMAIWLANDLNSKVILGSATPSLESFYNTKKGKFALVQLMNRYLDTELPKIELIDMTKSKRTEESLDYSQQLIAEIKMALSLRKQIILFKNRRGYAPFQLCESCGWTADCINCDVNLTYHKHFSKLLCHYCGYSIPQPPACPNCASSKLSIRGLGTEKIEDDLEVFFPDARIARMDLDTTRKKHSFDSLITSFESGSIDILVGTQMVTKGLDFENVSLVGVMNADALWNRPDFRAFERAFQLLTQVSGRAGRKSSRGKVLIQTYNPDHPVLERVVNHDYRGMYEHQVSERQMFDYPPFSRIVKLTLMHNDARFNRAGAEHLKNLLKAGLGKRVLGPEEPPIARIRGKYIRQIFIKLESSISLSKSKKFIQSCLDKMDGHEEYRKIRIQLDVDPN